MDWFLLAQAATPPLTGFEGWLPLVGQGVTSAVLAWFMYYTVSVAGPAKDKAHSETIEKIVNKFDSALSAERSARETSREADRKAMAEMCRGWREHQ